MTRWLVVNFRNKQDIMRHDLTSFILLLRFKLVLTMCSLAVNCEKKMKSDLNRMSLIFVHVISLWNFPHKTHFCSFSRLQLGSCSRFSSWYRVYKPCWRDGKVIALFLAANFSQQWNSKKTKNKKLELEYSLLSNPILIWHALKKSLCDKDYSNFTTVRIESVATVASPPQQQPVTTWRFWLLMSRH